MSRVLPGEKIDKAFFRLFLKDEVEKRFAEARAADPNADKKALAKAVFLEHKDEYADFYKQESAAIKDARDMASASVVGGNGEKVTVWRTGKDMTTVIEAPDGTKERYRLAKVVPRKPRAPLVDAAGKEVKRQNVWTSWMSVRKPDVDKLREANKDKSAVLIRGLVEEKYGKDSANYKAYKAKWDQEHPKKSQKGDESSESK